MKNLFIDANIWLSLFDFTNEKIEKFEVLKDMMKDEINLIIPEQVYYEVLRNRDGKIKNAGINSQNLISLSLPSVKVIRTILVSMKSLKI